MNEIRSVLSESERPKIINIFAIHQKAPSFYYRRWSYYFLWEIPPSDLPLPWALGGRLVWLPTVSAQPEAPGGEWRREEKSQSVGSPTSSPGGCHGTRVWRSQHLPSLSPDAELPPLGFLTSTQTFANSPFAKLTSNYPTAWAPAPRWEPGDTWDHEKSHLFSLRCFLLAQICFLCGCIIRRDPPDSASVHGVPRTRLSLGQADFLHPLLCAKPRMQPSFLIRAPKWFRDLDAKKQSQWRIVDEQEVLQRAEKINHEMMSIKEGEQNE